MREIRRPITQRRALRRSFASERHHIRPVRSVRLDRRRPRPTGRVLASERAKLDEPVADGLPAGGPGDAGPAPTQPGSTDSSGASQTGADTTPGSPLSSDASEPGGGADPDTSGAPDASLAAAGITGAGVTGAGVTAAAVSGSGPDGTATGSDAPSAGGGAPSAGGGAPSGPPAEAPKIGASAPAGFTPGGPVPGTAPNEPGAGGDRSGDPNVGRVVDVEVISVGEHEVIVRLADGREGAIDAKHLHSEVGGPKDTITPGSTIRAALLARSSSAGRVSMSRTWALQLEGFEKARAALENREVIEVPAIKTVKSGIVLDLGIRAFLPSSQAELAPGQGLDALVGQNLAVNVVSVDESRRTVVVSRRGPVRAARRRESGELIRALSVGDRRKGAVTRVEDYGAFVDIGGVEGLVHRSELAWGRVGSVAQVVSVGDEVEVVIVDIKVGKRRVGLSLRQAAGDPYADLEVGGRLEGEVVTLVDYGAFIKVAEGVEGLCHLSELAEYPVRHPEEVVIPGDRVMVEVVSIDEKRRRVSLSVARAVRLA